ncbi:MAG: nucleotidyltransferase family protein [Lachnospiraceae bacterium]|nr:nucleotidyltransferase family protein [Lachnospiraceae bacterium]
MADMFDILRASLFTGEEVPVTEWEPIFEEMKQQTVAALPGEWLPSHIDAPSWRLFCMSSQAQWVRVLHAQDELLQLLEANDIPCVILKGAAAAMAYPRPTLRTMGDVDFLVKRPDFEKAAALLEENGYVLTHEKDLVSHHYGYAKNHIHFELHRRIPLVSETDETWMSRFEEGIDAREWHEIEGYRFPTLPVTLNGLVLMLHIDQHLRSGLGLRQIIDWMMYAHTLPEDKWKELQPLLKEAGVDKLARTTTVLCQKYLGLRKMVDEDDSLPVDELLAYILEKGNFGRKAGLDGRISGFSLSVAAEGGFLKRLQAGGLSRWKAARKNKVLRPFAWIYQSFRILGELWKNKKNPMDVWKLKKHGEKQRELIEALGLQMDRTIPHL